MNHPLQNVSANGKPLRQTRKQKETVKVHASDSWWCHVQPGEMTKRAEQEKARMSSGPAASKVTFSGTNFED